MNYLTKVSWLCLTRGCVKPAAPFAMTKLLGDSLRFVKYICMRVGNPLCEANSVETLTKERSKRQLLIMNSLWWPFYFINSVDNTKFPFYTLSPTQHHSFFRNVTPLSVDWLLRLTQVTIMLYIPDGTMLPALARSGNAWHVRLHCRLLAPDNLEITNLK